MLDVNIYIEYEFSDIKTCKNSASTKWNSALVLLFYLKKIFVLEDLWKFCSSKNVCN